MSPKGKAEILAIENKSMEEIPPRVERQRIAARASCDERSVKRAYEGLAIRSTTRERIEKAAKAMGLTLPPRFTSARLVNVEAAEKKSSI